MCQIKLFFYHEGHEDHEETTRINDLFVFFMSFMVSSFPYLELLKITDKIWRISVDRG